MNLPINCKIIKVHTKGGGFVHIDHSVSKNFPKLKDTLEDAFETENMEIILPDYTAISINHICDIIKYGSTAVVTENVEDVVEAGKLFLNVDLASGIIRKNKGGYEFEIEQGIKCRKYVCGTKELLYIWKESHNTIIIEEIEQKSLKSVESTVSVDYNSKTKEGDGCTKKISLSLAEFNPKKSIEAEENETNIFQKRNEDLILADPIYSPSRDDLYLKQKELDINRKGDLKTVIFEDSEQHSVKSDQKTGSLDNVITIEGEERNTEELTMPLNEHYSEADSNEYSKEELTNTFAKKDLYDTKTKAYTEQSWIEEFQNDYIPSYPIDKRINPSYSRQKKHDNKKNELQDIIINNSDRVRLYQHYKLWSSGTVKQKYPGLIIDNKITDWSVCLECSTPTKSSFKIHECGELMDLLKDKEIEKVEDTFQTNWKSSGFKLVAANFKQVDVDRVECNHCDKLFFNTKSIKRHLSDEHNLPTEMRFICKYCGKVLENQKSIQCHELREHGNSEYANITCDLCGKSFVSISKLKWHTKIKHETARPFVCEICPKSFKENSKLTDHRKIHTKPTFFCKTEGCDKAFTKEWTLTQHERIHTGVKPYKCDVCYVAFVQKNSLNVHNNTHHKDK